MLNFLDAPHTPAPLREAIALRQDISFQRHFLKKVNDDPSHTTLANIKKITTFAWLKSDLSGLLALNGAEQAALVSFVMASGMNTANAYQVIHFIIHSGQPAGRRAAAAVLHRFGGTEAQELLFELSQDDDPHVQASVIGHLRDTGAPGALPRLIQLLESPHEVVHEVLRECLAEFTFRRYLAAFDTLDESVQATTGTLVKRVDPEAIDRLRAELQSPARNRQLRGISMAIAMDAVRDVEQEIINLSKSPDHIIRRSVVKAMACCGTQQIRTALRDLLLDRSTSVQEAAERALQGFAARQTKTPSLPAGASPSFASTPHPETPA